MCCIGVICCICCYVANDRSLRRYVIVLVTKLPYLLLCRCYLLSSSLCGCYLLYLLLCRSLCRYVAIIVVFVAISPLSSIAAGHCCLCRYVFVARRLVCPSSTSSLLVAVLLLSLSLVLVLFVARCLRPSIVVADFVAVSPLSLSCSIVVAFVA